MKKLLLLTMLTAGYGLAKAQVSITSGSLSYFQDFDGLDTMSGSPFNTTLPPGWAIAESGTGAAADGRYRGGNGSSSTGDTYSFGSTGSTERALGGLTSGTVRPQFGILFTNNTGSPVVSMTISFRGEQWRKGNSATDTLRCYYGAGINAIDTGTAGYAAIPPLFFTAPDTSASAGALDGNAPAHSRIFSHTVALLLLPGSSVAIKWIDADAAGTDHGFAVDSLTVSFSTGSPASLSIVSLSPADGALSVNPGTPLTIVFDKQVGKGTGFISVMNVTDQLITTIPVSVQDVAVAGNTVTVVNLGLVAGKAYWATFDSTAFDTAGIRSQGIYDTSSWSFSTSPAGVHSPAPEFPEIRASRTGSGLTISVFMKQQGLVAVSVLDTYGRLLARQRLRAESGHQRLSLPLPPLPPGIYQVQVFTNWQQAAIRMLVK